MVFGVAMTQLVVQKTSAQSVYGIGAEIKEEKHCLPQYIASLNDQLRTGA